MRTRASRLSSLCLLLPLAAACDRNESPAISRDGTVAESPRAGDREKSSLVLAGQLRTVNPARQTLFVEFGDDGDRRRVTGVANRFGRGRSVWRHLVGSG